MNNKEKEIYQQGFAAGVAAMMKEVEPELKELYKEREAYRQELIFTLHKATVCKGKAEGEKVCSECPYFYILDFMNCPTLLTHEYAEKRLKELCNNNDNSI